MKRKNAQRVALFGVGVAITVGCTADMRNLNGCRAVTSAVCERNRDCDPVGFDASFANLDACIDTFMNVLSKQPIPTGNDTCGPITTDCLDEIEVAACGRTTILHDCGIVRSIRPGRSGSSSSGNGADGGVPSRTDGGPDIAPLTTGAPDVLELRQGVLVACRTGEGCRSSAGDTYGAKAAEQVSFAVDSLRNVYGINARREVVLIAPGGATTLVAGPWDRAFSLPSKGGSVGAAFTRGAEAFFVVGPGEKPGPYSTPITNEAAPISGVAALPSGTAVYGGGRVSICTSSSCASGVSLASASTIRGVEGAYAGTRFVAIEGGQALWSDGFTKHLVTSMSDCAASVVAHDDSIACITSGRAFRIDGVLVPGASDVAQIAIDKTNAYWVTSAGTYHRVSRSSAPAPDAGRETQ